MKTLKQIAQVVVERRQRPNPTVMQGEMLEVLGEDGFATAIARRWLVPSYESGFLQVTNDQTVVQEMVGIADTPEPTPKQDESSERTLVLEHAERSRCAATMRLDEIAAPGLGRPSPVFRPASPSPTAPPSPSNRPGGPRNVGDDVAVVENGRTFQGKVQKSENGRYRISFGGTDRPQQDREYSDDELQPLQQSQQSQQPQQ